jgi:hypothetical protein
VLPAGFALRRHAAGTPLRGFFDVIDRNGASMNPGMQREAAAGRRRLSGPRQPVGRAPGGENSGVPDGFRRREWAFRRAAQVRLGGDLQ